MRVLRIIGPGLLYAGAAIGVSHLVQSTRAGAMFNYELVWVIVVANLLKYPFFEYGQRYAIATGKNLVDGYRQVGMWAVLLFALLTVVSMFIVQAAVTVVTVGLLANILGWTIDITLLSALVLLISIIVLLIGKYSVLDKLIKFIIILLAVSTFVAVLAALGIHKTITPESIGHFSWTRGADILFLISFMGWMPAPIDISVWSSMWSLEKSKSLGYVPDLKSSLTEFRIGYIGTALLAVGFLLLGALVMYGSGDTLSERGVVFADQLITMYTVAIGDWSYWVISIAAFTTMFSTTITVLDAYSRVMNPIVQYLVPAWWAAVKKKDRLMFLWLMLIMAGAVIIIGLAATTMIRMITVATVLSFLVASVMAWLNYRVVTDRHMPEYAKPGKFLRILSWAGIIYLLAFSLIYIYWVFAG